MSLFKSNIWKMYLFESLFGLYFIIGAIFPFYLNWGQINFTQIMFIQSWFVIWVFLLEVPSGAIADIFGRKKTLILATIVHATATIVYVSKPNFYIFLLGEFLWATSIALFSGASYALVYDSLKKIKEENQSKKIFGRLESFSLASMIIAVPIGNILNIYFGPRSTMLLMFIPSILAFVVSMTLKDSIIGGGFESKRYIEILKKGVKYFYSNKVLKILAFDMISIAVLLSLLFWLYPHVLQILLKQLNIKPLYFGFIQALAIITQITIMNNFDRLENIIGSKKKVLFLTALIPGIGFILLGINSIVPITILLITIITPIGFSRSVLFSNYMNKFIESHNRATILSIIKMIERFFVAIIYSVLAITYPILGLSTGKSLNYILITAGLLIITFALLSRVKESHLID